MGSMQIIIKIFLIFAAINSSIIAKDLIPVVTGPISISNFDLSEESVSDWSALNDQLIKMKELGVTTISSEVWWSVVEKTDNQFDWSYYDKLSNVIIKNGLKWRPQISFYSCQKTISENCDIALPHWIWNKYVENKSVEGANSLKYLDENGSSSNEVISVWATEYVLSDYKDFLISFEDRFSEISTSIDEIVISLGPDGELRYPSYSTETPSTKGLIQAHSKLAIRSFQNFVKEKYKTIENINSVWSVNLKEINEITPPKDSDLLDESILFSTYSKDFYAWYNKSLLDHAEIILTTSIRIFNSEDSKFKNKLLGTKVPNIHWDTETNRLAELNSGLIQIDEDFKDENLSLSYQSLLNSLSTAKVLTKFDHLFFIYTGLEKSNFENEDKVRSRAKDLVFQLSELSKNSNIDIKGSNSSSKNLGSNISWDNMWGALQNGNYSGISINRMDDLAENPLALDFLCWIIDNMKD
jgi:hypothetical protein